MAIINQGIMGGFSGKAGPMVGSSWKSKAIMKAKPIFKKNRTFSQSQLDQQEKFKMMMAFLSPIENLLLLIYNSSTKDRSGFQEAFSTNIKEAVAGEVSPFSVDFSKLQLANGALETPKNITVVAEASSMVKFSWSAVLQPMSKSSLADKTIAILYNEAENAFVMSDFNTRRGDQELLVDASTFTDQPLHCWLFCLSDDERKASKSKYVGTVTVIA